LEQCLGAGLQRTGTFRVNLAREGSWDLHAHYHGDPFPLWAERIAALVERGVVPPLQRGDYDLRLDSAASREAWRALLEAAPSAPRAPAAPVAASTSPERRAESAPLSVVIAIRDRAGARVRNALASLSWQQPRPAEVIVVSQGSRGEIDAELRAICAEAGARLLVTGRLEDPWCKPLALNVGIRATNEHSRYVMTMDADMILAPNFLGVVVEALSREPRAFVMCQISDLGRMTRVPGAPRALEEALPRLRRRSRLRGVHGSGAIQAARREFFFEVRGYDEDMIWWGAEDGDMVARAERSGMSIEWVTGRTYMLHQWHPKRHSHLTDTALRREASRAWERNHQLARERTSIARNPLAWGGAP
ncbi:MAG TPA: glycosyltransferase family 2 protein, partial [Polyangiaceae bacterium]